MEGRSLVVSHQSIQFSVVIPSFNLEEWAEGESVRDAFINSLHDSTEESDLESLSDARVKTILLFSRFLSFQLNRIQSISSSSPSTSSNSISLLLASFRSFSSRFLNTKALDSSDEIHSLAETCDTTHRPEILRTWFEVVFFLKSSSTLSSIFSRPSSSLLISSIEGKSKLGILFGGQGVNDVYFKELEELNQSYSFLHPFISIASSLLIELSIKAESRGLPFYNFGFDLSSWLSSSDSIPPLDYLASVPISVPLIGVTQLLQCVAFMKVQQIEPSQLVQILRGITGHSQGIVSAVALSASSNWESFVENFKKAIQILFYIGMRAQDSYPIESVDPHVVQDCTNDGGEGHPSPMLSVSGVEESFLTSRIETVNFHLDSSKRIGISLFNGRKIFVVSGPPRSLHGLVTLLRKDRATPGDEQAKIPFGKRKPNLSMRFLNVGVPFHSQYLESATASIQKDLESLTFWEPSALKTPVFHTHTGENLQSLTGENLLRSLCEQILTQPVRWETCTAPFLEGKRATHLLDFGPGGNSGIGPLTSRNLDGKGIRIMNFSSLGKLEIYSTREIQYNSDWVQRFAPKLVKTRDGKIQLDTLMSRLLGVPPLMIPGMTPTTVQSGFVSATLNAGYHIELAGGGQHSERVLRDRVQEIQNKTQPGMGITLNSLYINPRLWNVQVPLWLSMKREGLPIYGLTVAAGIPSPETAKELLSQLREAGIRHVSFKPGSVDGLRQVANIALANPDIPVICQWTGGRAGGHHSFEDFHTPILATYGFLRSAHNLVLVVGSGFGGVEDTWPYLSGEWSKKFGSEAMPFDGFLFGSWTMIAKEAHTSEEAKTAIVEAKGVEDLEWEGSYAKSTGGIITVRSELGEPIHKIATRGVLLWREFDDSVFALPKEKRGAWLSERKDYVIKKLNADFQKVWFPKKKNGEAADEVGEMTYEEISLRLIELLFISDEKRWIDVSLRNAFGDWLKRVEARFAAKNSRSNSLLTSFSLLDENPRDFFDRFIKDIPDASKLVSAEDAAFFLDLCGRAGQKPVPFVPILDNNFEFWFKKDSLWQSEDIAAVQGRDVGRICILQGPVAVKHAVKANVPIKEMLGEIEEGLISKLLAKSYGGDSSSVPQIDYLGGRTPSLPENFVENFGIQVKKEGNSTIYSLPEEKEKKLPTLNEWIDYIAGKEGWLRALLTCDSIVQGSKINSNPFSSLLSPRHGSKVSIETRGDNVASLQLFGTFRNAEKNPENFGKILQLSFDSSNDRITVEMIERRRKEDLNLVLYFKYRPEMGYAPIHEEMEGRNQRIKLFYWNLWFGKVDKLPVLSTEETFKGEAVKIDEAELESFCGITGASLQRNAQGKLSVPMDFSIRLGWESIMKATFPSEIDGDLLRLVHLSNSFEWIEGSSPLAVGDVIQNEAKITAITNSESGKTVSVEGTLFREGKIVMRVLSRFLFRGSFNDYQNTFQDVDRNVVQIKVKEDKDLSILNSKSWIQWKEDPRIGTTLRFKIRSVMRNSDRNSFSSIKVTGNVYCLVNSRDWEEVGKINYESEGTTKGDPVWAFLQRRGEEIDSSVSLSNSYSITQGKSLPNTFHTPRSNENYAICSGDFNPIHVNPLFSNFANLPGTITHGMFTSAATRKIVQVIAAENCVDRFVKFEANFVGMVLPNDLLTVSIRHVGQREGIKLFRVETHNQKGEKVVDATAEIRQPSTAYVFTGQGSQEVGMGMSLYESSVYAREVWDEADEHLLKVYGFSILDIVKNNPKEKTIHFGGLKGQDIRERYMNMTYDTIDRVDGSTKTLPLFPEVNIRSGWYTFNSPTGLLFATQFAQIALVLVEKAAFEDLRRKGLVPRGIPFAGHSLGEYSALASLAEALDIPSLCDVVFFRGITMQRAVERDEHKRSNYAMVALNPTRVSPSFTDSMLREVVDSVAKCTDSLCEIVNYNVENQQYVAAGELVALQTLTNALNYIKFQKFDIASLIKKYGEETVKEKTLEIVNECFAKAKQQKEKEGHIKLDRGIASIPLPGIDVPFHSKYLWPGVVPFRQYLSKKIQSDNLQVGILEGKYIPNLLAEPFELSKRFAQKIYDRTSSPPIEEVLKNWDQEGWGSSDARQRLGFVLLVELLAYQFASPVRWIETQDVLFSEFGVERFIEIGPSPTLSTMASRTLASKYETRDAATSTRRTVLCVTKDSQQIFYQFEDQIEEVKEEKKEAAKENNAPVSSAPVVSSAGRVAVAKDVPDVPLSATQVIRTIVAQKLKKNTEEIPLTKTIKDLVGGKSTLQNEILGDLQAEFSSAPEKGEEIPLEELGAAINSSGYKGTPGKFISGLISRVVAAKMPGGFGLSAIKSHLEKSWGLGAGRIDAVLLLGITMEPPTRLSSENEAKGWLDGLVQTYAKSAGIELGSSSGSSGSGPSGGVVTINSEEFDAFKRKQESFIQSQIELFSGHLDKDLRSGDRARDLQVLIAETLQSQLDSIRAEHGETYENGIKPLFAVTKARHFDSWWNWVRQDMMLMWYDIIFKKLTTVDREITNRCINIMNRTTDATLQLLQFYIQKMETNSGDSYDLAKKLATTLLENCKEVVQNAPRYRDVMYPTGPQTQISSQGDILYSEIARSNVRKLEAYVKEMAAGSKLERSAAVNLEKINSDLNKLWKLVSQQPQISRGNKSAIKSLYGEVVKSLGMTPKAHKRERSSGSSGIPDSPADSQSLGIQLKEQERVPYLYLKRFIGGEWKYSTELTSVYLEVLGEFAEGGTTFEQKNALLTGVGKGSIGVELLKGLLAGGGRVVATTSSYNRETVTFYQNIYREFGAKGSSLVVVPFNQGSKRDVEALIDYIYDPVKGLGMDLDYVVPFAAISENGREIDGIDDKSELAHRLMMTNVLRLLGCIKSKKAARRFVTRPTQVLLPLSPNHGTFGGDGLYGESKSGLETLLNRWKSESWSDYICLVGAVIGWTRGTGLMNATNIVAEGVEKLGVRTFSSKEMAFNLLGLMHPLLMDVSQVEPLWADLSGGMLFLPNLNEIMVNLRNDIKKTAENRKAVIQDEKEDERVEKGDKKEVKTEIQPMADPHSLYSMPSLPKWEEIPHDMMEMLDLEKVIVIVGHAEVGPWGSGRTRWEKEAYGEFSTQGLLELCHSMGLIRFHREGTLKSTGKNYVGWIDAKSGEPVSDSELKSKYQNMVIEMCGIREMEPQLMDSYDPKAKETLQEVVLERDLIPLEASQEEAEKFKLRHGEFADVWRKEGDTFMIQLKRGAKVCVPKASPQSRFLAGLIPRGWDPLLFGIPQDIVAQTDRVTQWALVCVSETLASAGIKDPYELFKHIHVSELGNTIGSGMGGMQSLRSMFLGRRNEKDVQKDILQETFINTVGAWVQLLLLSASGPVQPPVAACATAAVSLDLAVNAIQSGKAKAVIAGGFDDISEEGSVEFANMGATNNNRLDREAGREPSEASRPASSSRSGFLESQGGGTQLVMSAKLALEMGLPIYAIVAMTATAMDKAGRSIPAPGRGILSTAREIPSEIPLACLNLNRRKIGLEFRMKQIQQYREHEKSMLDYESSLIPNEEKKKEFIESRNNQIQRESERQERNAKSSYGNLLDLEDPHVSPIRRALATFNLGIDDIDAISFHGTSTVANEKNESATHNSSLAHLGRSIGNVAFAICQKNLTGHPKGGAASWMLNGAIQSMLSGRIPGNSNLDNVGPELQDFSFILFPSVPIQIDRRLNAVLVTSFGFGQSGAEIMIVNPARLFSALNKDVYSSYCERNAHRERIALKKFSDSLVYNNMVIVKENPSYTPEIESKVLLNPLARTTLDSKTGKYSHQTEQMNSVASILKKQTEALGNGLGCDVESVDSFPYQNENFLRRNYTEGEINYCLSAPSPKESFAGRWAAKESVFKAMRISGSASAPMKDIEIVSTNEGPLVVFHGRALEISKEKGINGVKVSISHSVDENGKGFAIATALIQQ
eukprot:TRINITY_DN1109_c0_g1_i4.p1 TRINITY_DN1109_c0_g1~~TRINITY_DN1109_c0_g1_i4.p1  ORF type:complete len:3931 (+),score=1672.78 TRINITY_DN1109_c0_g1_i4:607-12399(+)